MVDVPGRPLLVLVANHADWIGRSLASVVESQGYAVLLAADGRQAHDLALEAGPDALILDTNLAEMEGVEVCRSLRAQPGFDPTIPIFITTPGPTSNRERAEAYEAGAWEVCSHPVDPETLLAKLAAFGRARQRVQAIESRLAIDPETGLYSAAGLQLWAAKMAARAARKGEPLAYVVVAADAAEAPGSGSAASDVAEFCRLQSRRSDVVGRVGDDRVAILAPETDGDGARLLVERLNRARTPSGGGTAVPRLSGRAYAVADFAREGIDPSEFVGRATLALELADFGPEAVPPGATGGD